MYETIYLAGGCLWGVQHFMKSVPGVITTEAGRANGAHAYLSDTYDGYAECVKLTFDPQRISVKGLMTALFDIIDPYSVDQQGQDCGHKYRTGVYSENDAHLNQANAFIRARADWQQIQVEVAPLTCYVRSAAEHQNRLERYPDDYQLCHIPLSVMNKYRT